MPHRTASFGDFLQRNPRWRWVIIGLVVFGVLAYEFIEHQPLIGGRPLEADFVRDVIFYGIVSFLAASYLVNQLERLNIAYHQSRSTYDNLERLIEQLTEADDYLEASAIYFQALRANLPISGAQLLLYDPTVDEFINAASWAQGQIKLPQQNPIQDEETCTINKGTDSRAGFPLTLCACAGVEHEGNLPFRYCTPLFTGDQLQGMLYLYHSEALRLDPELEKLMHGMVTEFAITLERVQLQVSLEQHKASQFTVHERIARDMHATLGHNLAYIRMKLDQISTDYPARSEDLHQDLTELREAANETYQQMRDLLVALTPEKTPKLRSIMIKYAQRVADRAGFKLETQFTGEIKHLPAVILRQIVLIVREALGNIEKHSHATRVEIRSDWQEDGLNIQIEDNGHGFDTSIPLDDVHLGIRFMQERAREMDGELVISSAPNKGTNISLWIPYPNGT